jgi:hypothetical protein
MTPPKQILNWLAIGLEQSVGSLNENFYYDRRDNEFFSIMAIDYFMVDDDMHIQNNVTTNYSKIEENLLIERMTRIENNDPLIIAIPRVSLDDRKTFMQEFVKTLSDTDLVKILNQRIKNQDYRSKFDFYFGSEADELTKEKWENEKQNFLLGKAETFLNLNNINIGSASIWEVDTETSISIDLTDDHKVVTIDDKKMILQSSNKNGPKRRWWKFW